MVEAVEQPQDDFPPELSLDSPQIIEGLESNQDSNLHIRDYRAIGKLLKIPQAKFTKILRDVPLNVRVGRFEELGWAYANADVTRAAEGGLSARIRYSRNESFTDDDTFNHWARIEEMSHVLHFIINNSKNSRRADTLTKIADSDQVSLITMKEERRRNRESIRSGYQSGGNDAAIISSFSMKESATKANSQFCELIGVEDTSTLKSDEERVIAMKRLVGVKTEGEQGESHPQVGFVESYRLIEAVRKSRPDLIEEFKPTTYFGKEYDESSLSSSVDRHRHYSNEAREAPQDDDFARKEAASEKRMMSSRARDLVEWIIDENKLSVSEIEEIFGKAGVNIDASSAQSERTRTAISNLSIADSRQAVLNILDSDLSITELRQVLHASPNWSTYSLALDSGRLTIEDAIKNVRRDVQGTVEFEKVESRLAEINDTESLARFINSNEMIFRGGGPQSMWEVINAKQPLDAGRITEVKGEISQYISEMGAENFDSRANSRLRDSINNLYRLEQRKVVANAKMATAMMLYVDDLPYEEEHRQALLNNPEYMKELWKAMNDPNFGPLAPLGITPEGFLDSREDAEAATKGALSKIYNGQMDSNFASFVSNLRSSISWQISEPGSTFFDLEERLGDQLDASIYSTGVEDITSEEAIQKGRQQMLTDSMNSVKAEIKEGIENDASDLLMEPIAKVIAVKLIGLPTSDIKFHGGMMGYSGILDEEFIPVWLNRLSTFLDKASSDDIENFFGQNDFEGQQNVVRRVVGNIAA